MMYEVLRDKGARKSGAISAVDVDRFITRMRPEERVARAESFAQRWEIER